MKIMLNTDEIKADKLIELDAGNGFFYIGNAGGLPERPFIYFYADEFNQFFFSGYWGENSDNKNSIVIDRPSINRLSYIRPKIDVSRIDAIKHNISFVFQTRRFASVKKPVVPSEVTEIVQFDWGF